MFGGNRKKKESLSQAMTPENSPRSSGGGSSVTGFDPEGLERAAKAARDLDSSRNANQAIELIKTQEMTKQVRFFMPFEQSMEVQKDPRFKALLCLGF